MVKFFFEKLLDGLKGQDRSKPAPEGQDAGGFVDRRRVYRQSPREDRIWIKSGLNRRAAQAQGQRLAQERSERVSRR